MEALKKLLNRHYGVIAGRITPRQGGWSALAYEVETNAGILFLKMYEKNRASTPKWTSMIPYYVPLLLRLGQCVSLQGKLPAPILTVDGQCKCENEQGIFLLYTYIEGETIGPKPLTAAEAAQLADILAELHTHDERIAIHAGLKSPQPLKENFELPFIEPLVSAIRRPVSAAGDDIGHIFHPFQASLTAWIDGICALSRRLRQRPLRHALCHTDLHHWNLMSSDGRLVLIDWEGMRFAPVEADWMFIVDQPYYEDFLAVYRRRHPGFSPDPEILSFYQGRRMLEDIWEFSEQLLFDRQDAEERADIQNQLMNELQLLDKRDTSKLHI